MTITIAEARRILGPDAEGVSDEEILRLLEKLRFAAKELLDMHAEGKL